MASIDDLIKAAQKETPDADPQALARSIYRQIEDEDLVGLIAEEVEHRVRNLAREMERTAFAEVFGASVVGLVQPPSSRALSAVLDVAFKLGDGRNATWGLAGVEEHRTRIRFLEMMRDGVDRTIGHHRRAIEVIEEAGVTCLAELPNVGDFLSMLNAQEGELPAALSPAPA